MTEQFDKIRTTLADHDVVLYMKGSAQIPMCGFSGVVVQILNQLDVPFHTVDVMKDPELREAIKAYTDWPTLPQLYVKGEFIGGCDIVREMYTSGELQECLNAAGIN